MNVGRRIVPECSNVILLEHAQQHAQQRSLAPWSARVELKMALADIRRRLESGPKRGHVRACEPSAIRGMVIANGCRDLSLVEGSVRGSQAGGAALRGYRLLLIDHVLERAREVRLAKDLTGPRWAAARQEHLSIAGEASVLRFVGNEGIAKARIGGEAVTRQSDSCSRNVTETHRPVALKCRDPSRRRTRNHGPHQPCRDAPSVVLAKPCR